MIPLTTYNRSKNPFSLGKHCLTPLIVKKGGSNLKNKHLYRRGRYGLFLYIYI